MNKYLMLSAAALLGSSICAMADDAAKKSGNAELEFQSSTGGTYCDQAQLQWKGDFYIGEYIGTACGTGNGPIEFAYSGKVKGGGGAIAFSVALGSSFSSNFIISTPIKNGGTWSLTACQTFSSCFELASGTYKLAGTNDKLTGNPSVRARLKEMLKQRGMTSQDGK